MNKLATFEHTTDFSNSVDHFFYTGQIRRILVQFSAIFSEMQVSVGKNNNFDQQTNLMTVPIKIGSMDRVVAAIMANNTQNTMIRAPIMASNMMGIEPAYEYIKGRNQISRETVFPVGGTLPDDGKVVYKYMPSPYWIHTELAILATNELQHQQMLEQILLLFNPDLQIQLSDAYDDWTKISHVELTSVGLDTPYPSETDRRLITTRFNFRVMCYLSPPMNIKDNYVKKIKLRISSLQSSDDFNDYTLFDVPGTDDEYTTIADVSKMHVPPN
jgi:hypothetical protein